MVSNLGMAPDLEMASDLRIASVLGTDREGLPLTPQTQYANSRCLLRNG